MKKHKYLFSVVVPIYNTEDYLEECIESIVNQTIGFENIQLILINDSSPDNSEEICLAYKNKYPDNIIYELQENRGHHFIRNKGIWYSEGKYCNFLDCDDKWDINTFKEVYDFFENNSTINTVIVPSEHFEAKTGSIIPSIDDWETGIKDIYSLDSTCFGEIWCMFFKLDFLKFNVSSRKYLGTGWVLAHYIFVSERYFGYVSSGRHFCRKRLKGDSILDGIDNHIDSLFTYLHNLRMSMHVFKETINTSLSLYGFILKYIKKSVFYTIEYITMDIGFEEDSIYFDEMMDTCQSFFDMIYTYEDLLSDENIRNEISSRYKVLFLLNWKYKDKKEKSNKINMKNLIEKGIIKDDIKEYCFLQCTNMIFDEYKNVLIEFIIDCPIDINIERTVGEGNNGFEREATLQAIEDIKIFHEVCFKKYKYVLKVDRDIAIGNRIKFWLEINRIQYASNLIIDLE